MVSSLASLVTEWRKRAEAAGKAHDEYLSLNGPVAALSQGAKRAYLQAAGELETFAETTRKSGVTLEERKERLDALTGKPARDD